MLVHHFVTGQRVLRGAGIVSTLALTTLISFGATRVARGSRATGNGPRPHYEIPSGRHLVAYVILSSRCGFCTEPTVRGALARIRDSLMANNASRYANISVVGVAIDGNIGKEFDYLRELGPRAFDELSVGGSWMNSFITQLVWRDRSAEPATPSVVIVEREVDASAAPRNVEVYPDSLVLHVSGRDSLISWVDHGARIPQPPGSADSTFWSPAAGLSSAADLLDDPIDVAVNGTNSNRLYVADKGKNQLFILDSNLNVIGTLGAPGNAVGQYRELTSIRTVGVNGFVTLDGALRRLYIYRWTAASRSAPSHPKLVRAVRLVVDPNDFCANADGSFTILGLSDRRRLHQIDSAGKPIGSFAPFDTSVSQMLAAHITAGRMHCDADARNVVITSNWLPTIRLFTRENKAFRETRVDSMHPVRRVIIQEDKRRGRLSFGDPGTGFHRATRPLLTKSDVFVAAPLVKSVDTEPDSSAVFRFSLSGSGVQERSIVEGRLFPIAAKRFLSYNRHPNPILRIVTVGNSPSRP
jgi:hypothetical protein